MARRMAGSVIYSLLLSVYSVTDKDSITLLDTLDLNLDTESVFDGAKPRVDIQTGEVYIPCGRHGLYVVRYDGSKLVPIATLRCMEEVLRLAVASPDNLYRRGTVKAVCEVDINQKGVTDRLKTLILENDWRFPCEHIAVLGDTVLWSDTYSLYICRHGISTPEELTDLPVQL